LRSHFPLNDLHFCTEENAHHFVHYLAHFLR